MISFFTDVSFVAGEAVHLGLGAAQHARARRVDVGAEARVLDGRGRIGTGEIAERSNADIAIRVHSVVEMPPPKPLALIVPVADRDRLLLAAEKSAELQATLWQPAYFQRSRSVNPRGEGEKFLEKVRARMASALEQSGGAWLPDVRRELEGSDAWNSVPDAWTRLVLDSRGTSIVRHNFNGCTALAIGPEGGFTESELAEAASAGWTRVSLTTTVLRFETAVIAATAFVRSVQASSEGGT